MKSLSKANKTMTMKIRPAMRKTICRENKRRNLMDSLPSKMMTMMRKIWLVNRRKR